MDPVTIAALVGGLGTLATNVFSARAAKQNREFQERMSNTAHQREMRDLRAAGINPALRGLSGAGTPPGNVPQFEDIGRGASTAAMAKAQVGLVKAQTAREHASAMLLQQQRFDLEGKPMGGAGPLAQANIKLAELDLEQKRNMFPLALEQARAAIQSSVATAEGAKAVTLLNQAALQGAKNTEELEKLIADFPPAVRLSVRFFLELAKTMKGFR